MSADDLPPTPPPGGSEVPLSPLPRAPMGTPVPDDPAQPPDPNRRLHIFLSYRREDSSGQAGRLYDSLSEHFGTRNVFMDLDTIQPGEDFVDVIDEALKRCDCVLVVIGPRWLQAEREGQRRLDDPADYLRIEVEHSLARAPRVIPVLIQDADMPGTRELPDAIKSLARRNAFELSDSRWRLDVARLIDALEQIEVSLGLRPPDVHATGTAGPSGPSSPLEVTGLVTSVPPAQPPFRSGGTTGPPSGLPPWIAQRIVPIVVVLALLVVAALGAFVLTKGSPTPTSPPGSGIAVASGITGTSQPGTNLATANPSATGTPAATGTPNATGPGTTPQPSTPQPSFSATPQPSTPQPGTPEPSFSATPQPTPVVVLPPGIGLGATKLELDEPFTSPGKFPVISDARGTLAYAAGGFDITVAASDHSLWSAHFLPARHSVLRVRASVTAGTDQLYGGLMCGNGTGDSGDFLYGAVDANNHWAIGSIVASTIQNLESGTIPVAAQVAPGTALDVRLECAVTGASSDRVQLIVGGFKVADNSNAPRVGPFNSAALLGSSSTIAPASVHFDNATIWSGETFREATESLRSHVPTTFAGNCKPTLENGSLGQVAALICTPAATLEQGEYYQFDTPTATTKQFEDSLKLYGSTATGTDCHTGPSSSRYTDTAGKDAGNVACYPNPGSMGGLLIIWTNESLDILSAGFTTTGTYDDLATWWQTAGPLP